MTDFGVFVKVQGDIDGLIKKQDLSEDKDEPYDDALKRFSVGQAVKALVIELSPSARSSASPFATSLGASSARRFRGSCRTIRTRAIPSAT